MKLVYGYATGNKKNNRPSVSGESKSNSAKVVYKKETNENEHSLVRQYVTL